MAQDTTTASERAGAVGGQEPDTAMDGAPGRNVSNDVADSPFER
jgi:hypothetical protein